jgi:hypothetical protein
MILRAEICRILRATRSSLYAAALLSLTSLLGCSSQQLYGAGQAWQQQECNKIMDAQERGRCMASANTSYEEYKRQSESAKAQK